MDDNVFDSQVSTIPSAERSLYLSHITTSVVDGLALYFNMYGDDINLDDSLIYSLYLDDIIRRSFINFHTRQHWFVIDDCCTLSCTLIASDHSEQLLSIRPTYSDVDCYGKAL